MEYEWFSFWEWKRSLVLFGFGLLADSSLLYKHSATTENWRERDERVWEKEALSWFGYLIFVGCNLELWERFCYHLVLVLRFGDLLSLGALQLLHLICDSLWFMRNWYLVFGIRIWYLWTFGSLIRIWFFDFVFVRESYLGVFEIWVCESTSTLILLSQICYSEICLSSPVDVGYCRTT